MTTHGACGLRVAITTWAPRAWILIRIAAASKWMAVSMAQRTCSSPVAPVFLPGGYVNPTLSIAALALRLADHMQKPQHYVHCLGCGDSVGVVSAVVLMKLWGIRGAAISSVLAAAAFAAAHYTMYRLWMPPSPSASSTRVSVGTEG